MKICRPFDINIYKLFAELFFGFAVGCFVFFFPFHECFFPKDRLVLHGLEELLLCGKT